MNILFIASTGVYQGVLAAHLHMGTVPTDYNQLPCFGNHDREQSGQPIFMGEDTHGNRIYTLGVGLDIGMVQKCLEQLKTILGADADELLVTPILIRSQDLISFLQQVSRWRILKPLSIALIIKLLKKDLPSILGQLPQITKN